MAADALGIWYVGMNLYASFPVGCFWRSENAFFNDGETVSNIPAYSGNSGGICLSQGIRFILRLVQSYNQYKFHVMNTKMEMKNHFIR